MVHDSTITVQCLDEHFISVILGDFTNQFVSLNELGLDVVLGIGQRVRTNWLKKDEENKHFSLCSGR